jgi:hypothetical protein
LSSPAGLLLLSSLHLWGPPCYPRSHAPFCSVQIELEPLPSPISARRNVDDLSSNTSTPAPACSTFRARPPPERLRLRSAAVQPPTTHGEHRQPPNPS